MMSYRNKTLGIPQKGKTLIIAEAGVNHNGDIELAKRLVDVASDAEADAVKFQTFVAQKMVSVEAPKAEYQLQASESNKSQLQMLKEFELSKDEHLELFDYCQNRHITFLSSPFDFESADMLDALGVVVFKIASGEITNLPFLEYIAKKNKPIIMSTGMASLGEVEEAINTILGAGNRGIVLLHCVTGYPARFDELNLLAIQTMKKIFGLPVGFSDHTLGIAAAIAAVALGACAIEKHFTTDKNLPGPDHKASLEPAELKMMIRSIRNIEKAFGDGTKKPARSELQIIKVVRKSLVASQDIEAGEILTKNMVNIKRPGTGIEPKHLESILGRKARRKIRRDEVLRWEMF